MDSARPVPNAAARLLKLFVLPLPLRFKLLNSLLSPPTEPPPLPLALPSPGLVPEEVNNNSSANERDLSPVSGLNPGGGGADKAPMDRSVSPFD